MASGSVKCGVDSADDSSDLQISQNEQFVFGAVMKMTDLCFCFNYFAGKHAFRAVKYY
jgi:hypothetical protein